MKTYLLFFLFITTLLYSQNINSLLEEFESNSEKSLYTVDEKLGHVKVYSQKHLKLMQYTKLSDLFEELTLSNLSKNRFGVTSLSLPGTKTDVSGFFRVFINNHEISSNYTQSASGTWVDFPMDLVDYIEVYRGDSSFSLGSGSGIFFIRIYTKKPSKENSSEIFTSLSTNGSSSQSISHADTLENGWSYLTYFSNSKKKNNDSYNGNKVHNNEDKRFFYLNVQKDKTDINFGYSDSNQQTFLGFALDADPDYGEMYFKDYFLDFTTYFLDDESIKLNLSYDVNKLTYDETNEEGLAVLPVLDFNNMGMTIPKEFYYDNKVEKIALFASKSIDIQNNNIMLGFNYQNKKYKIKNAKVVNFANIKTDIEEFTDFNKEEIYSLFFQDNYKITQELMFVLNAKIDKHKRAGGLDDFTDEQYRVGAIYNINENFGIKSFYAKTYIAPSFYNIDHADSNSFDMKNQTYKYYTIEGVYVDEKVRLSLMYNDVKVSDFIYLIPTGFINVDETIGSKNVTLDFTYDLSAVNSLHLSYFYTDLSERLSNPNKGANIKWTGEYDSFSYFASLVYRNGYNYLDADVGDSYNFSMGATYNISKDISISAKVKNLFDDSTQSLYNEGFLGTHFTLENSPRDVEFSMKWVF